MDAVAGPEWLDEVRFDVNARASDPQTTHSQTALMLRSLIATRLHLKFHFEQRQQAVYLLLALSSGSAMRRSENAGHSEDVDCSLTPGKAGLRLVCSNITMADLAYKLPQIANGSADRRVLDRTGIEGHWDIAIEWMPANAAASEGGRSLFDALKKQLGLELRSAKADAPVLVIDSGQQSPDDN